MKKIIWLFILMQLFTISVEASEVYYSNYSDYSSFQEKEIVESDLVNVEKETRYLWYKETKILGKSKLYNDRDDFSNDCYTVEHSGWIEGKPVEQDGTTYETRIRYDYQMQEDVRYVHLYNFLGSDNFKITELHVYINNEEIDYTYECTGCADDFSVNIKNGIYDDDNYVENGGEITIDLGKLYPINQIKIDFYIFDQNKKDKLYTIGFSKDKSILFSATHTLQTSDYDWSLPQNFSIDIYNSLIPEDEWTYEQTLYQFILNNLVLKFNRVYEYKYSQKFCKVYETMREYNTEYTVNAIGNYNNKDDDESKIFYRYQIRNKIELDIKEIENINFDLNEFVKYSSSKYTIIDNINWNKNGKYQVSFVIDDLIITKDIVLNLKDITINELKKNIEELENKININNLNSQNEITIYQNKIENLNSIINNLNVKTNQLNNEKMICEEEVQEINTHYLQLEQQINNNYIPKISSLEKLNIFYENKVKELEEDIRLLNTNVKQTIIDKDAEISNLKENLIDINQIKEDYKNLQNEVEVKNKTNNDITTKYNYVLKINQQSQSIIFWVAVLICIFILLSLINNFRLRKKSNKKKV